MPRAPRTTQGRPGQGAVICQVEEFKSMFEITGLSTQIYTVVYENLRLRNVTLQVNLTNSNVTEVHDLTSRMKNRINHFSFVT